MKRVMSTLQIILVILGILLSSIGLYTIVMKVINRAADKFIRRMDDHENYTGFDNFKFGSNQKISDNETLETGGNFEDEVKEI